MAKSDTENKVGRPRLDIDADVVEKLASIHCTMKEIGAVVGCSVDTLERNFADVIEKGRETGKISLRRMMFENAKKGSVAMQIWLSKQHLAMREPQMTDFPKDDSKPDEALVPAMTKEQWKAMHNERQKKCVP